MARVLNIEKGWQAMFIDRLLNQGPSPLLEQWLNFTDKRQDILAEDVVNHGTPGYKNKDMSLPQFQAELAAKEKEMEAAPPGSVDFNDISMDIQNPRGLVFHDGTNISMEKLMSDEAKNALMHNTAVELLRQQFTMLDMAIKERPE